MKLKLASAHNQQELQKALRHGNNIWHAILICLIL